MSSSRAHYLKHLEHDLDASRKIINDLTQENYELREQLRIKMQSNEQQRPTSKDKAYA